jgi:hypothetical protein
VRLVRRGKPVSRGVETSVRAMVPEKVHFIPGRHASKGPDHKLTKKVPITTQ